MPPEDRNVVASSSYKDSGGAFCGIGMSDNVGRFDLSTVGKEHMTGGDVQAAAICVLKVEGALNQILGAIDMWEIGRYDCAITLAGAAEGMLPATEHSFHHHLITSPTPLELEQSDYALLSEKERNAFWNKERDWLKHWNKDQPKEMVITRFDAEGMIARALTKVPPCEIPVGALESLKRFWLAYLKSTGWTPPAAQDDD